MNQQLMLNWEEGLKLRGRGRPRTASEELRGNNYRDPDTNQYVLTNGLKHWHERIVDFMLLNPNAKIVDVARYFQVSPQWIGQLFNTDAFKEYYSNRMREHQGLVGVTIVSKMQGVAVKALDKIADKIDHQDVPMAEVREVANMAVKALGYGVQPGGVRVNVNQNQGGMTVIGVSVDVIAKAREDMARARQENTKSIEHDPNEYRRVTAAMDVSPEEVEDAIFVAGTDE